MSEDKKHILIVDDSPDDIRFIMEYLANDYAIQVATNGKKGLEIASREHKPDVVLMDVVMPEMDGYETCRQLKQNPHTEDIDVIFISAHDTTQEKIAGYDAGGSDYLIKPVRPEELHQKIKVAIQNREKRDNIQSAQEMAFQTAMTAMSSAGEQGTVLEFFRTSFAINSPQALAQQIVESVAAFELHNTVQIRSDSGNIHAGTKEPISPLEEELLFRLKDENRVMTIGPRAIFNYGNVSLLIKNMPEDEEKSGRYRDHIAILMEGASAKWDSMQLKSELVKFLDNASHILAEIQTEYKAYKNEGMKLNDDLLRNLEDSFIPWGLTDAQEESLLKVVQEGIKHSTDHYESGTGIDKRFRGIINELAKATRH